MKRRDKLYLAGTFVLLASVGATAALIGGGDEEVGALTAAPSVDDPKLGNEMRTIAKLPGPEEIPQEFKEVENYLLDRWSHMEDAGLAAPGIMPEGDMFFQDRKLLAGVRGNGKPIYAKTYVRPERFRGPVANKNSGLDAAMEHNPSVRAPYDAQAQALHKVAQIKKKSGVLSEGLPEREVLNKMRPLEDTPGSHFRPRGDGAAADDSKGLGGDN